MSEKKYHYTYQIQNLKPIDGRTFYIGVRSCSCLPEEDTDYWGSQKKHLGKAIENQGKQDFKKYIIKTFPTRLEAAEHEMELHEQYDVVRNHFYYNRAKSTSTGWDSTGIKRSEETRQKIGFSSKGRKWSGEAKEKQRKRCLEHNKNNPDEGKRHSIFMEEFHANKRANGTNKHTDEQRKRNSAAQLKWWRENLVTEEKREQGRELAQKSYNTPRVFYCAKCCKEMLLTGGQFGKHIGLCNTTKEERSDKFGSAKGKTWYHNPDTKRTYYGKSGTEPEGFIRGRGKLNSSSTKGMRWYHNPITKEKYFNKEGTQPEGYVVGKGKRNF